MEAFSFYISPDHKDVFLAVLQRDLHKAELLIASLQGARLDSASHPFFHEKEREILETVAKRISAYAWSPLWSLSNKRRSFNLVTTGAYHYTRHAEILASSFPPMSRMSCLTSQVQFWTWLWISSHQHLFLILMMWHKKGKHDVFLSVLPDELCLPPG